MLGGVEWLVDVDGLAPEAIAGERGRLGLERLFGALVRALDLHPLHAPFAHVFDEPRGVTLLVALHESHLAGHSYPEAGYLSLNLYTCRARPQPDWERLVRAEFGPARVRVRTLRRGGRQPAAARGAR